MKLVGNYHYGRAVYEGSRYMIVKNGDMLERIFLPARDGKEQRTIWECGDPMTQEVLDIMTTVEWDYEILAREKREALERTVLASPEMRELVRLYFQMSDRAEAEMESAGEASMTGEENYEAAALIRFRNYNRISSNLAKEIRALDPSFNFMDTRGWLERQKQKAAMQ